MGRLITPVPRKLKIEEIAFTMDRVVHDAELYATEKHAGQKRKYTGEPYIVHPRAVAERLKSWGSTPELVAAGWLHDTVEDTDATIEDIKLRFGPKVARIVLDVTDVSKMLDAPRKERKQFAIEHLRHATPEGQNLKCADILDNVPSMIKHDPDFAKIYLEEKAATVNVLTKADLTVIRMLRDKLFEWEETLRRINSA